MRKLALISALLLGTEAHATDYNVHWGLEQYNACTSPRIATFTTFLNSPVTGNVYLRRIVGMVKGMASGIGTTDTNYTRAALGIYYNASFQFGAPPNARTIIIKQTGAQSVSLPINIQFAAPLALPGGSLSLELVIQSYPMPAPPSECLDVEMQVTVMFSDTLP